MSDGQEQGQDGSIEREYPTWRADGTLLSRTVIKFSPDGREVARYGYDSTGQELWHEDTTYIASDSGRETTTLQYGPDGALSQRKFARFDRSGELLEWIISDSDGRVIDRQVYSFSDDTVHYSRFDETGRLVESWTRPTGGRPPEGSGDQ